LPNRNAEPTSQEEETMGCCGQNREIAKYESTQAPIHLQSSAETSLRFVQRRSIVVRGPITGKRYQFHESHFTPGIDPRDVTFLLKSGFFEKAAS
jgi:hypothetical protein